MLFNSSLSVFVCDRSYVCYLMHTDILKEKVRMFINLPVIQCNILDKSFHPFYFNVMTNLKMHLAGNLETLSNHYL